MNHGKNENVGGSRDGELRTVRDNIDERHILKSQKTPKML